MRMNKLFAIFLTLSMTIASMVGMGMTVNAEDNPYNYSGEPSRAIYYVLPTMKGDDVKWVQCALNLFGNYGLAIDGSFGPACKEATLKFQAAMGIEQDGSFGPATRRTMVNWLNSRNQSSNPELKPAPSKTTISDNPYNYSGEPSRAIYYVLPTMKGNDVKWVQAALNSYGGYGLAVDGSFGPACKEATLKFQAAMGMSQDGSFGPATKSAMVSWLSLNGCTVSTSSNSNTSNNQTTDTSSKSSYNRNAAVDFARQHTEKDIRDLGTGYGTSYCHNGWLCDTFVSGCLRAGGLTETPNLNPALYSYIKSIGTEYQLDLINSYGYLYPANSSNVSVGDVVCWFDPGSSSPSHYTLVGGVDSNNRITVYAHNKAKLNEASCVSSGQRATVIHFE